MAISHGRGKKSSVRRIDRKNRYVWLQTFHLLRDFYHRHLSSKRTSNSKCWNSAVHITNITLWILVLNYRFNSLLTYFGQRVSTRSTFIDILCVMTGVNCLWNIIHEVLIKSLLLECHYSDVIIDAIASQITSLAIVYSVVYSSADKKTSKLRVTVLCVGNSPGTGEFPAQMASNAENVSIWWRLMIKSVTFHLISVVKITARSIDTPLILKYFSWELLVMDITPHV